MTLHKLVLSVGAAGLVVSNVTYAACFPPNKLHLQPSPLERSNISEAKFNQIIDRAEAIYAPIIKKQHKAKLIIHRLWKDKTVNASANQDGSSWEVNMYGGLARRPEITPDGFAMVLCHEIGHHLGGYSYYSPSDSDETWAANEGQSDYFATHACAKEIWKNEPDLNLNARQSVQPFAKRVCDTNFTQQSDRDICYRSSNAGLSLATLLAKLRKSPLPKFETPDPKVVDMTFEDHPEAQCRLDTYLAGSACTIPFQKDVIPAKELADKYGAEAERASGKYTCLARDGWLTAQRPRCWFKPFFEFEGLVAQQPAWSDASGNRQAEPGEKLSLKIPLTNKLSTPSESVTGELFSQTQGITVENAKVDYADLQSAATVQPEQSFTIKVSKSFACGHPFELTFRASAKTGSREFPIKWHTGPKISADFILGKSGRDVVIPDSPSEGIAIPITVSREVFADQLALDMEVDGLYPEENEFKLRLPDGSEVVADVGGQFDRGSKASVLVRLPKRMSLAGRWALKIRDLQENDTLTLKSFTLRAPLAEPVSCTP